MLDEKAKSAISLLRNYRHKTEPLLIRPSPEPSVSCISCTPATPRQEVPTTHQFGLFAFERAFQISNYHFKRPNEWTPVMLDQEKARFERMMLPVKFTPLCLSAQAVVVSGFGCQTQLHLQIVPGHLVHTALIQQEERHLGHTSLAFDGFANPMAFMKVSRSTKGPDLLIRTQDGCPDLLEFTIEPGSEFRCLSVDGSVKCSVPKGMTLESLGDKLAESPAGRFFSTRSLADPRSIVDLPASVRVSYKPNCHTAQCKGLSVEAYQGIAVIAKMPKLDQIIHYELQLSVVCGFSA